MKSIDEIFLKLPKLFFICMVILVLIHIGFIILNYGFGHDYVFGLNALFHLDLEQNFPTWFSTLILFTSSLLLYIIHGIVREIKPNKFWLFLSIIFLYLSVDEMVSLHERLVLPLRHNLNLPSIFYFGWIIAGLIFVCLIGILSIPFLRKLPKKTSIHFVSAGAIYVFGAIGMEMIGGHVASLQLKNTVLYVTITTIEETLEMLGIIFFNYALVRYLQFIVKNKETY